MNTSSKGNSAELRVAADLEARGWLCASRRHIGGAGDLLAVRYQDQAQVHQRRLIEVKSSSGKRGPFADFPPKDRKALLDLSRRYRAEPLLAWSPSPRTIKFIPAKDWP